MARSYSIYEAKARLSEVLRNVKRGAEVIVTERGVPIAKVIPIQLEEDLEARTKRLAESGNILPATFSGPLPRGKKRSGALKRFLEERE